jgi:hypothetical protein
MRKGKERNPLTTKGTKVNTKDTKEKKNKSVKLRLNPV